MIVLEELRRIRFPKCKSRMNVSKEPYEGFVLGEVNYRGQASLGGKTRGPSRFNKKYGKLYDLLKDLFSSDCSSQLEDAQTWTTIQVNKNMKCLPHIDRNNVGPSFIIALGDFTGGELVVEGEKFDVKNKFVEFDGTKGHWTEDFKGERYSLVFFTHTFKPPLRQLRGVSITTQGQFLNGEIVKEYPRAK